MLQIGHVVDKYELRLICALLFAGRAGGCINRETIFAVAFLL